MTSLTQGQDEGEGARSCVLLPEESVCLKIADTTEAWLLKTKRIMQGNSFVSSEVTKGTQLDLIQDIFREGCSIPLNLEYEMRPLRVALRDTGAWMREYSALLGMLGMGTGTGTRPTASRAGIAVINDSDGGSGSGSGNRTSSSSSSNSDNRSGGRPRPRPTEPGGEGLGDKDGGVVAEGAPSSSLDADGGVQGRGCGNANENGDDKGIGNPDAAPAAVVTYDDLQRCVAAGSSLSADFRELR
jgi:hypothetical protein